MRNSIMRQFESELNRSTCSQEFFEVIFEKVETLMRYAADVKGGVVQRGVFFGESYTHEIGEIILNSTNAAAVFAKVEELRIVATGVDKQQGLRFKRFNPAMRVVWMSSQEWIDRANGATDPAGLENVMPPDYPYIL